MKKVIYLQKNIILFVLLAFSVAGTAVIAQTSIPHSFTNGSPADAAEINENFDAIIQGLNDIQNQMTLESSGRFSATVDCTSDANAFMDIYQRTQHIPLSTFALIGDCSVPLSLDVSNRVVSITGRDPASLDCNYAASLVPPVSGRAFITSLTGGMYLDCMKLGFEGTTTYQITSAQSSFVNVFLVRGLGQNVEFRSQRGGSLLTSDLHSSVTRIVAEDRGSIRVTGEIPSATIIAQTLGYVQCGFCTGNIESLWLSTGGAAHLINSGANQIGLTIESLIVYGNSNVVVRKSSSDFPDVTVVSQDVDSSSSFTTFVSQPLP